MNVIFKKDQYGYYEIAKCSQGHLLTIALMLTDSTHVHAAEDVLANKELDEVCGNMYCIVREKNNLIGIDYIYSRDDNDKPLLLNEADFAYLTNKWKELTKLKVEEITITYNDGKYEMTGK